MRGVLAQRGPETNPAINRDSVERGNVRTRCTEKYVMPR
jgi:hypothetical protein